MNAEWLLWLAAASAVSRKTLSQFPAVTNDIYTHTNTSQKAMCNCCLPLTQVVERQQ